MIIKKLYSEPQCFTPIKFESGLNIIIGDKDESSNKTNGVGKSLSVEFINFALLQDFSKSRIKRIPKDKFSPETLICLDIDIGNSLLTIKRSKKKQNAPLFFYNGKEKAFENVSDARDYLKSILNRNSKLIKTPSLRKLLAPIIRDEKSEFKNILDCFDTSIKSPRDLVPHFHMLGIDYSFYEKAKKLQKEIDINSTTKNKIKKDVELLTDKSIADATSELNDLKIKVDEIKQQIDEFESLTAFETFENSLLTIEGDLERNRTRSTIVKREIKNIKLFEGDNYIDSDEVSFLFNSFKDGLGDIVKKELDQVISFKRTIDNFQKSLLETKLNELEGELAQLKESILQKDRKYREIISRVGSKGKLKTLKDSIKIYNDIFEQHSKLAAFVQKYEDLEQEIKNKKRQINSSMNLFDDELDAKENIIKKFEATILDIHQYVMGNAKCSFKLATTEKKCLVEFHMRIHDDGSRSINREKIFIYDLALLLTKELKANHLGFLIHDNIFDVDQDTLVRSLNYLYEHVEGTDTQYILTLNRDKLSSLDFQQLTFDFNDVEVASFTKMNRFLGVQYQEQ